MLFQNSMSNFTKDVLYIQTIVYSWKLCLAPRKTVFVKSDTKRPLQVVNYVAKHRIIIFPKGFLYTNKEWDKKIKIFDVISRFYKQINCNSDLRAYNEIVCVQFFLLIGHKDLGFAYVFIRWTLHCEPYHVVLHKESSLLWGVLMLKKAFLHVWQQVILWNLGNVVLVATQEVRLFKQLYSQISRPCVAKWCWQHTADHFFISFF